MQETIKMSDTYAEFLDRFENGKDVFSKLTFAHLLACSGAYPEHKTGQPLQSYIMHAFMLWALNRKEDFYKIMYPLIKDEIKQQGLAPLNSQTLTTVFSNHKKILHTKGAPPLLTFGYDC